MLFIAFAILPFSILYFYPTNTYRIDPRRGAFLDLCCIFLHFSQLAKLSALFFHPKGIGENYGHLIWIPKWFKTIQVVFLRIVLIGLILERDTESRHDYPWGGRMPPNSVCPLRENMFTCVCGAEVLFLCWAVKHHIISISFLRY